MDPWIDAVTTVGFPIVSFFAMFWLVTHTIDQNTQAIKSLTYTINLFKRD